MSKTSILQEIIADFLKTYVEEDWIHFFIADPKILDYCGGKLACFNGEAIEGITLLQAKKAMQGSYRSLASFIRKKK